MATLKVQNKVESISILLTGKMFYKNWLICPLSHKIIQYVDAILGLLFRPNTNL